MSEAEPVCHSCKKPLDLPPGPVGRGEECSHCRADVRVCLNCKHYDTSAYNDCRESMAERVVDKDRRNFCDYFAIGGVGGAEKKGNDAALAQLDALFKK